MYGLEVEYRAGLKLLLVADTPWNKGAGIEGPREATPLIEELPPFPPPPRDVPERLHGES